MTNFRLTSLAVMAFLLSTSEAAFRRKEASEEKEKLVSAGGSVSSLGTFIATLYNCNAFAGWRDGTHPLCWCGTDKTKFCCNSCCCGSCKMQCGPSGQCCCCHKLPMKPVLDKGIATGVYEPAVKPCFGCAKGSTSCSPAAHACCGCTAKGCGIITAAAVIPCGAGLAYVCCMGISAGGAGAVGAGCAYCSDCCGRAGDCRDGRRRVHDGGCDNKSEGSAQPANRDATTTSTVMGETVTTTSTIKGETVTTTTVNNETEATTQPAKDRQVGKDRLSAEENRASAGHTNVTTKQPAQVGSTGSKGLASLTGLVPAAARKTPKKLPPIRLDGLQGGAPKTPSL